jgi:hypothetical protein
MPLDKVRKESVRVIATEACDRKAVNEWLGEYGFLYDGQECKMCHSSANRLTRPLRPLVTDQCLECMFSDCQAGTEVRRFLVDTCETG